MAKGTLVAAGVALLAIGGGLAGYGATRPKTGGLTPEGSAAMTSAIGQLDGDIKAARASVNQRAQTLADLQAVQAAVVTNETTTRDMLRNGELNFKPAPGEIIELGQIQNGMQPTPLLIQPEGGMHSPHAGKAGGYVELAGEQVIVSEIKAVTPKDRANELVGYVAVSQPLDLGPALAALAKAGVAGELSIGGKTKPIGTKPPSVTTTNTMPLPSVEGAQLAVSVPPQTGGVQTPLVGAGAGVGGLGLILLIVGLVASGKRIAPQARDPALAVTAPGSQPAATADTQWSAHNAVAAGTPAPADPARHASLDTAGVSIAPANLGAGAMIGRWEIIKRLGSGGMADVYLARARGEAGFEKQVAIKVMHPHLARNERAVEHFLDEAKLAARISHPNVVQIQDLGKIGNDYVIVMEYVDGVDLERLLASGRAAQRPVPIDVGLGILCRICDGLNAAHKSTTTDGRPTNLVHRDVKSANVLVSKQGGVKVVDFGIAKATSQQHLTVAGETKGTPSMMAPEQRVGEQVDVRADVYSVGAVAFEILTGHGVNLDLAALAHLGVENWPHLPLPSSLRPQLPQELDGLLMSAMAFDRERRPADCAAFEAQFEAIMKRHNFSVSDKDIARWVQAEVAQLIPASAQGASPTASPR